MPKPFHWNPLSRPNPRLRRLAWGNCAGSMWLEVWHFPPEGNSWIERVCLKLGVPSLDGFEGKPTGSQPEGVGLVLRNNRTSTAQVGFTRKARQRRVTSSLNWPCSDGQHVGLSAGAVPWWLFTIPRFSGNQGETCEDYASAKGKKVNMQPSSRPMLQPHVASVEQKTSALRAISSSRVENKLLPPAEFHFLTTQDRLKTRGDEPPLGLILP